MTAPPSVATLLKHGVADLIRALTLGPPVISGALPAGKADQAFIGVITYPAGELTDELAAGQTITATQITIRGTAFDGADPVLDIQQAIRDALTWLTVRDINTIPVSAAYRQLTSGPPVLDDQGRPTVYDTFDMRSGRPGLIPQQ